MKATYDRQESILKLLTRGIINMRVAMLLGATGPYHRLDLSAPDYADIKRGNSRTQFVPHTPFMMAISFHNWHLAHCIKNRSGDISAPDPQDGSFASYTNRIAHGGQSELRGLLLDDLKYP